MRVCQMNGGDWQDIEEKLGYTLKKRVAFLNKESVSGGCINQAWKITDTDNNHYFIKVNSVSLLHMFDAEADALTEIKKSACIRTPEVISLGDTAKLSYLILEYIPLQSKINQTLTGTQLAKLHHFNNSSLKCDKEGDKQCDKKFGWKRNNTIGSTKQSNRLNNNWVTFWKNERLLHQLNLAKSNGYSNKAYDKGLLLAENLSEFFITYQPKASLLHGDLWRGNCATDSNNDPVIFDPAVYYGDRETDIAMTELFGGFNTDFYNAYNEIYPLDADYKTRKTLYNLYHILNHFNLFGEGYASQAINMTDFLLSEIGR